VLVMREESSEPNKRDHIIQIMVSKVISKAVIAC
jgi:hypothetical protein